MGQIRMGQAGRASTSARLGAADPRLRRNAQQNTNDRDIGSGLKIDANGKLTPSVSPPLVVRNGRIEIDVAALKKMLEA